MALVPRYVINACQEDKDNTELAIERTPDGSNITAYFSYEGEWVNV